MEEHSVLKKRSVAELAGKFSCPIGPLTDGDVSKPVRRRPPRSLSLPTADDVNKGNEQKGPDIVSPRKRNAALIEKLQSNLVLSPTGPPTFHKNPSSPPVISPDHEEAPASFESPTDGTVLPNINKGRARHSIKRRPPSRRHRKSSTDECTEEVDKTVQVPLKNTTDNGHEDVFAKEKTQSSKELSERETHSDAEQQVEAATSDEKDGEESGEKTEAEVTQENCEEEEELANSTEQTCDDGATQSLQEPDTTDAEEEQKEEHANQDSEPSK